MMNARGQWVRWALALGVAGTQWGFPMVIGDPAWGARPNLCQTLPSPLGTTTPPPELWWAKEQLDHQTLGLISHWSMTGDRPGLETVEITVDRQRWGQLNYLDRYRIVHRLATVARDHQYYLRITNQVQQCLATYWCDFSQSPYPCHLEFPDPGDRHLSLYQFTTPSRLPLPAATPPY